MDNSKEYPEFIKLRAIELMLSKICIYIRTISTRAKSYQKQSGNSIDRELNVSDQTVYLIGYK